MSVVFSPQSFILSGYVPHHEWQGAHSLSLKVYFAGEALYEVEGGRQLLRANSFLILNTGQPYTLHIQRARSACVFFEPGLAESVARSLVATDAAQLDDLTADDGAVHFYERVYPADDLVLPMVRRIQASIATERPTRLWYEERMHDLMAAMLRVQEQAQREVAAVPAQRPATRDELYRRLHRARDFIAASYADDLTLAAIARVACLSPNHLLRSFRQLFAESPHHYLMAQRLAAAQRLLRTTELPVVEICATVGYTSATTFTGLFRRMVGCTPEMYRQQKSDFQEVAAPHLWHTGGSAARISSP